MNKFELYCMIFYVLDRAWEKSHDEALAAFLSDANPFLFQDIGSAVPDVYLHFCKMVDEPIPLDESYAIAKTYVSSLKNDHITDAFGSISQEEWLKGACWYLSHHHKGE